MCFRNEEIFNEVMRRSLRPDFELEDRHDIKILHAEHEHDDGEAQC